jgi:hypothetical protein
MQSFSNRIAFVSNPAVALSCERWVRDTRLALYKSGVPRGRAPDLVMATHDAALGTAARALGFRVMGLP